jgi:hypothetical protein
MTEMQPRQTQRHPRPFAQFWSLQFRTVCAVLSLFFLVQSGGIVLGGSRKEAMTNLSLGLIFFSMAWLCVLCAWLRQRRYS